MAIDDYPTAAFARSGDAPVNYRPPQRMGGSLAPATVIGAAGVNGRVVNVLGTGRIRLIAKYSAAGTLAAKWRLADHLTNQATNQPATVALVANTENVLDIPNNPGYGELEVSITDGGAGGTIAYVDVMLTAVAN